MSATLDGGRYIQAYRGKVPTSDIIPYKAEDTEPGVASTRLREAAGKSGDRPNREIACQGSWSAVREQFGPQPISSLTRQTRTSLPVYPTHHTGTPLSFQLQRQTCLKEFGHENTSLSQRFSSERPQRSTESLPNRR
ncbi:hypothetical protein Bbelb_225290 [Branchiostoma belcheri]|nr:hypothetical protein Bbelb_225290 [Branchiostoma belcheri]